MIKFSEMIALDRDLFFDDVLMDMCGELDLDWWQVVEDDERLCQLDERVARAAGISVDELLTIPQYLRFVNTLIADI